MKNLHKVIIFFIFLFLANLFLLQKGLWLYQDASYAYKTHEEILRFLLNQFYLFSNSNYYQGYDVGLFGFNGIIPAFVGYIDYSIFNSATSQVLYILSGYIIAFISFYLFTGIFFKEKISRYISSLLFVFSPFFFSLLPEEQIYMYASTPLFIYSFYKFFSSEKIRMKYVLLIVLSFYFTLQYLRFAELNIIVIVPYIMYLYFQKRIFLSLRKILILTVTILLLTLPVIYSFLAQLLEKSQTAFSYGMVFNQFSSLGMYKAFNIFQSNNLVIYNGNFYVIAGIIFYCVLFYLFIRQKEKIFSAFYLLNLSMLLMGITFLGLPNLVDFRLYGILLKVFPFLVNSTYYSLYILNIPLLMLLGYLYEKKALTSYLPVFLVILISLLPLLNLSDIQLKKFDLSNLPKPYWNYFIKPYEGIPEATHYIPNPCWRAEYMNRLDIPQNCINTDNHYNPVSYANPRLLAGLDYQLSQLLWYNSKLDNLRIIDNLKNIIVPNDIVKKRQASELDIGTMELQKINEIKKDFNKNYNLSDNRNPNFNQYFYKDKEDYDFFIYSPLTFQDININNIFSASVDIQKRPVFTDAKITIGQSPKIDYKISPLNPTKYYFKASLKNDKQFAIQFNQTFNENWRIVWISKKDYEKQVCISTEYFSITDNLRCQYDSGVLNLSDVKYLQNPSVAAKYHYKTNITNNMWVIDPKKINTNFKDNNEIYGVIIYRKQLFYPWMILFSLFGLFLTAVLVTVQELKIRYDNIEKHE